MKIAVLTSGIMPVPSVEGGAVEKLVDFFLQYNEEEAHHDVTVFSIDSKQRAKLSVSTNPFVRYRFLDTSSFLSQLKRRLSKCFCPAGYYDYRITYYLRWTLKQIAREHYDVVLIENRPAFAIELRKVTDALIVSHLHNDLLNASTPQCQEIVKSTDRFICVSNFIADRVKTATGTGEYIKTVYNGIDTKHFCTKVKNPSVSRTSLNIEEDDFVVVFTGRLIPEKGVKELLETMLLLKDDHPKIKLLLIGSAFYGANMKATPFISSLQPLLHCLTDSLVVTGYVPYTLLPQYLHISDVAIVPSIWEEPSGLVIPEALAAGLPVITTRCGGIPEIINNGGIALKVDMHFISNMKASILQLYHHPELRQEYVRAAQRGIAYYDRRRFAKEMSDTIAHWNDQR